MNASIIQDAMNAPIVARGCFIVEIKITKDNEIELVIESEEGVVTLDDCVEISRKFEAAAAEALAGALGAADAAGADGAASRAGAGAFPFSSWAFFSQ